MVAKFLRVSRLINKSIVRNFSAVEAALSLNERKVFARRAETNDTFVHTEADISKFYTVPKQDQEKIFGLYEFPTQFQLNLKTFNETAFMIRQPALEVINALKTLDPSKPILKFVIYGRFGDGKTITLSHVVHHAYRAEFILCHVPIPHIWQRWSREVSLSESKPGLVNVPIESAQWLKNFRIQNLDLLRKLDLRTTEKIVWSQRETTEKDAPLLELIDHGITRLKYSADVVDVLVDEIKRHTSNQKCKTLVAIDGFNCFFNEKTNLKPEDKSLVEPQRITLIKSIMKLTQADWTNAIAVVTVDQSFTFEHRRKFDFPLYLLTKEGFEHLDPFVPIHVPALSEKEFNNLLDFYEEKKWLLRPEGRHEIEFLSTRNAYTVAELCGPL